METSTISCPFLGRTITLPWPLSLEGRLGEATLAVASAHCTSSMQLWGLRIAEGLERHDGPERAAGTRRQVDGEAVATVEAFIKALALLERARKEVIRQLQAMREHMPAGNEELELAAAAVVDWHEEMPAADLLEPSGIIAAWLKTVDPSPPRPHLPFAPDTSRFDGTDLRINARIHGASPSFLKRAFHLMRPCMEHSAVNALK